jgi:threonine-phosphate decarboxylase
LRGRAKSKEQKAKGKNLPFHQERETSNQKSSVHGGDVHAFARASGVTLSEVIDFSASINPLGMPRSAHIAYRRALANIIHYPEPYAESLVQALADYHGLDSSEILVGNGSTQLIHLCARVLACRRVLLVAPLFSEYESAFRTSGAVIDYFLLHPPSFTLTQERLARTLTEGGYDALVLTNPNSPTGVLVERTQVEELANLCRKTKISLLVDETFMDWPEEEYI